MKSAKIFALCLLVIGTLMTAHLAHAQTAFKADGVVQSTSGGFKFPDGSVQTTASPPTPTITEYRIVGYTKALTDGSAIASDADGGTVTGIDAMNRLCELEFGTGARAAFSAEQLAPSIAPSTAPAGAWVLPTNPKPIFLPDQPDIADWQRYDGASGVDSALRASMTVVSGELECDQWLSNSITLTGLYRAKQGAYAVTGCDASIPVACSAPVQITNAP